MCPTISRGLSPAPARPGVRSRGRTARGSRLPGGLTPRSSATARETAQREHPPTQLQPHQAQESDGSTRIRPAAKEVEKLSVKWRQKRKRRKRNKQKPNNTNCLGKWGVSLGVLGRCPPEPTVACLVPTPRDDTGGTDSANRDLYFILFCFFSLFSSLGFFFSFFFLFLGFSLV